MHLVVASHKPCWPSASSPTGYATDGGFPFQMEAIAALFDRTTLLVPCHEETGGDGLRDLEGHGMEVVPLPMPRGRGWRRKTALQAWLRATYPTLRKVIRRADALHAPIPGDVGTIGLAIGLCLGKPLFVRHCGNWARRRGAAEHLWRYGMERFAGTRHVMFATGGTSEAPSRRNPHIQWIFSTTLTEKEIEALARTTARPALDRPRLVTVGRQDEGKGTELVVAAIASLRHSFPTIELDVVGDGPALDGLRRDAAARGVEDAVTFHGRVTRERVLDLMGRAHVFCLPSASEGFPKVVGEALAAGLPVVATRLPVLEHLLREGGGVLLRERTADALVEAVGGLLEDDARYEAVSEAARRVAGDLTLARWQATIRRALEAAWGPLREA